MSCQNAYFMIGIFLFFNYDYDDSIFEFKAKTKIREWKHRINFIRFTILISIKRDKKQTNKQTDHNCDPFGMVTILNITSNDNNGFMPQHLYFSF